MAKISYSSLFDIAYNYYKNLIYIFIILLKGGFYVRIFLKHIPGFRSNKNWKKIIACMYYLISILGNTNDFGGLLFMLSIPFIVFSIIDLFKAAIGKTTNKDAVITTIIALLVFNIGINNMKTISTDSSTKTDDIKIVEEIQKSQEDEENPDVTDVDEDVDEVVQEEVEEEALINEDNKLNLEAATVTQHVDGDTVYVRLENGQEYKLRMIGVDTPETVHPSKPIEFYGKEASDFTKSKLLGQTVYLEKDVSDTDRYGRLLRYIWLKPPAEITKEEIKSKMFNAILVANGYAQVSTYPPDVKYQEYFIELEREARDNNIGLWDNPDATVAGSSSSSSGSSGSGQSGYFPDRSETNKSYTYMGNSNSMKLHLTTCRYAQKTSESNRVYFNSRDEAINKGYVPCKVCKP